MRIEEIFAQRAKLRAEALGAKVEEDVEETGRSIEAKQGADVRYEKENKAPQEETKKPKYTRQQLRDAIRSSQERKY